MKKSYFVMIPLFLGVVFASIATSGCIGCFFDLTSAGALLLSTIFVLCANFKLSEIRKYFSLGFKKDQTDIIELKNGILFFTALQKYLILSGSIGTFAGIISMLANLGDKDALGSGMALALIITFYAIILSMGVAQPFKTGLQKRLNEISAT